MPFYNYRILYVSTLIIPSDLAAIVDLETDYETDVVVLNRAFRRVLQEWLLKDRVGSQIRKEVGPFPSLAMIMDHSSPTDLTTLKPWLEAEGIHSLKITLIQDLFDLDENL